MSGVNSMLKEITLLQSVWQVALLIVITVKYLAYGHPTGQVRELAFIHSNLVAKWISRGCTDL